MNTRKLLLPATGVLCLLSVTISHSATTSLENRWSWEPSTGPVELYEVEAQGKLSDGTNGPWSNVATVEEPKYTHRSPGSEAYRIRVRAVGSDSDGNRIVSDWSEPSDWLEVIVLSEPGKPAWVGAIINPNPCYPAEVGQ